MDTQNSKRKLSESDLNVIKRIGLLVDALKCQEEMANETSK